MEEQQELTNNDAVVVGGMDGDDAGGMLNQVGAAAPVAHVDASHRIALSGSVSTWVQPCPAC